MNSVASSPPEVLWLRTSPPPDGLPVLLWCSFGDPGQHSRTISIPRFIDENADEIRSRLLSFFSQARNVESGGVKLEAALQTPVGLSTWWLSFPALKQWGGRQSIPVACRLIALEMILGPERLSEISIVCDDKKLRDALYLAVRKSGGVSASALAFRRIFKTRIAHPLRALLSLARYGIVMRAFDESWNSKFPQKSAFFDHFAFADQGVNKNQPHESRFWGVIPSLNTNSSWYYIYPTNVERKGVRLALHQLSDLRRATSKHHQLFVRNVDLRDFRKLFTTYCRQQLAHAIYKKSLRKFHLSGSKLMLWHIFEDEWDESICGSTAMRHLILLFTTDRLVDAMPNFEKIFYLLENQPWEFALVHCAKKYQKGELIGVAHSTIRFWDLRYFLDPSENALSNPECTRPIPSRILTNGLRGTSLLIENGYPKNSIAMVEALRYSYISELRETQNNHGNYVLLLGDFLEHTNDVLLNVVRGAFENLDVKQPLQIRSHPICTLTKRQLGPLAESLSSLPLATLLKDASVVITTAASSSAAEAATLGIPTIIVLNPHTLNYSPFERSGNVYVVETSTQLEILLRNESELRTDPVANIFCLDRSYPRWLSELSDITITPHTK